MNFKSY